MHQMLLYRNIIHTLPQIIQEPFNAGTLRMYFNILLLIFIPTHYFVIASYVYSIN